ncbi:hypothetical protein ACP4OV_019322 [Aristida adscensionis]
MDHPEATGGGGAKKPRTSPPPPPPPPPPLPPVAALGEDLLREILLRLPDMASLASAALACKLWYRVASDPAVFCRFAALRRPPLVGFILTDRGDTLFPARCSNLLFVPASRNPNVTSAAADGDFFFEDLPAVDSDDAEEWRLRGCDGGRLLLSRGRNGLDLAVYDPIARTAVFLRPYDVFREETHVVRYAIVVDETDGSFLVIGFDYYVAIFSSRTGKWEKLERGGDEDNEIDWDLDWYEEEKEEDIVFSSLTGPYAHISFLPFSSDGMAAGRFAYWRSDTKKRKYHNGVEKILVLDTSTMIWSIITAPFPVGESYCVADMPEHGGLCLFSSKEQCLQLWVRNSIGRWVLKEFSLLNDWMKKVRRDEWMKRLRILAARAG